MFGYLIPYFTYAFTYVAKIPALIDGEAWVLPLGYRHPSFFLSVLPEYIPYLTEP